MSHPPERPGRPARMSNIRGPQSALTDFLASHNIDANRIRADADARRAAALASRQAAESNDDDAASPLTEPDATPPPARKKETAAQQKKRKKEEENAIAKIKASKSFQRQRRGYDPEGLTDEDEAAEALYQKGHLAPLPGQMENCALCEARFTVTTYSPKGPDGGLLCPKCSKELAKGGGAAKKKRNVSAPKVGRRAVQSKILDGTFKIGAKDLLTLCVETLAKNVDLAEELGSLPQKLIDRLEWKLSQKRLINSTTLNLFLNPNADIVAVHDGARLNSDDYIRIFQAAPNIAHLHVENAIQFKNKVMEYLVGCPVMLESFVIHGANLIDDEHWNSYLIQKGRHLRTLKICHTDNHFGDDQLESIKISCPDLVSLKVSHNQQVTDVGIRHIADLPCLQSLVLEIYKSTSSESYIEVLKSIGPGLQKLTLKTIENLDDSVLEAIHDHCWTLKKLRLTESLAFTDAGFAKLFTNWHNQVLEEVDLYKCAYREATDPSENPDRLGLVDEGFEALMAHSGQRLRLLRIASCRHISIETFEKVFAEDKKYPELMEMDVSFILAVNDFVVGSIFRSCPNLKSLKVFGNFGVTQFNASKGKLLIGMPNAMGMTIEGEED